MKTNRELDLVYRFLQYTGTNVFLTGKAGTGKTTFLQNLKQKSPKRMIVLAPTGVAAINAGGMTLHSFFQLPFGPYVPGISVGNTAREKGFVNRFSREKINIIRSMDLLVIDEVSMVRADLLDAVSDVLCRYRDKSRPFGGVQLLLIGDLQQLAPVVKEEEWHLLRNYYDSPFFFNSRALRNTSYISIELKQVFRQSDTVFLGLLNRIRDCRVDGETLDLLNRRYIPDFSLDDEEDYVTLTTHNAQAQAINARKLEGIAEPVFSYRAEVEGNFPAYAFPTAELLELKKGAQVMFVKNDSSPEKRYYNGKIGKITAIAADRIRVACRGDREEIEVGREEWTNTKYFIDPDTQEISETVEGVFRQYPLKTAWAITVHKSQGLTFEHLVVDISAAFTHGQVYVALSRCKSLEGLVLMSPLRENAVIRDAVVRKYTEEIKQQNPGEQELKEAESRYYLELLTELFDFTVLWKRLQRVARVFGEYLAKLYPDLTERYRNSRDTCYTELTAVGEKFKTQLKELVDRQAGEQKIDERVRKGVVYFSEKMQEGVIRLLEETHPEIDNKDVRKLVEESIERLWQEVELKKTALSAANEHFSVSGYLEARAKAVLEKTKIRIPKPSGKIEISGDIRHPDLYRRLKEWRKEEADRLKLPVYTVMQQKALIGVCNTLPTSGKELLKIPGIGKKVVEKYGTQLLDLVDEYRMNNMMENA